MVTIILKDLTSSIFSPDRATLSQTNKVYLYGRTYLELPFSQAAIHMTFIAMSTGIWSMTVFGLPKDTRRIPLPPPTKRPIGPLKLSIHPGKGSFSVDITVEEIREQAVRIFAKSVLSVGLLLNACSYL